MEFLGNCSFMFDHFVLGMSYPNTDIIKTKTALDWFEHTHDPMERAMVGGMYYNIDYVEFCNHIEIDVIKQNIQHLWELFKISYPYGTKEDYKNLIWRTTIYSMEDFINEDDKYPMGYFKDGYALYFYNDKLDAGNNIWVFIEQQYTPEFYSQYYKVVLNELNNFFEDKNVKESKGQQKPTLNKFLDNQKIVVQKLIKKGHKISHIYRFLKDEKQYIDVTETEFKSFIKTIDSSYDVSKRITPLTGLQIPIVIEVDFKEFTQEL